MTTPDQDGLDPLHGPSGLSELHGPSGSSDPHSPSGSSEPSGPSGPSELHRLIELLLAPPLQTADLAGIGGRIRMCPEDFTVHEIPAYAPDGRANAHLLLTLTKRNIGSEDAINEVSRQLNIPRPEIGLAGLKDTVAVTEQWISVPFAAGPALASFSHPQISLGSPHPHGNKLRRGHLHGNRFILVVRDLAVPGNEAVVRVAAKRARLAELGGLDNLYGQQRLGEDGGNLRRGLAALAAGKRRGRADFLLSAGQSTMFNLYLLERRARGLLRTVLRGDILKKGVTGGIFECREPEVDQARLDSGELGITGPMFGSKMRAPGSGTPSGELEREILARAGISQTSLSALGNKLEGTRRPLQLPLPDLEAEAIGPSGDLPPGIRLGFSLPAGSYATVLLQELQGPPGAIPRP